MSTRALQLWAVFGCCLLVIALYHWKLAEARNEIGAVSNQLAQAEQKLAEASPSAVAAPAVPCIPAAAESPQPPADAGYYPPDSRHLVEDVYNPEENGKDRQSVMDAIKKRYEDILVTYMFLKRCGKATPADYYIIAAALGQEVASVNAPGRLQYDVLTSARGSYKEIYSKSQCEGPGIDALIAQYGNYIKALSDNAPKME